MSVASLQTVIESGVLSLAQLLEQHTSEEPPCLVEPGLLPPQGILFVGGEPKVGKSLLVANLALSLAAGSDRTGLFYPDTMGHIRYRQIDVRLGNGGLPLSEISNIAATASDGSATAPVHRQKVGRNEPCPCGSGKKFKKCCGA
jgi:Mrp family chromosome partitioning ATPase